MRTIRNQLKYIKIKANHYKIKENQRKLKGKQLKPVESMQNQWKSEKMIETSNKNK